MSKKKNKFKKNKKQQVENVPAANRPVDIANPISEPIADNFDIQQKINNDEKPDVYKTDKYDHVKKDIKKILIIMLIIVLALFGTYLLSFKTSFLGTFGNWVYELLNIQAS